MARIILPVTEVRDLYDVLQVDPAASPAAVRAAYRRLARALHPDRGGSGVAMSGLNAAYAVLRDPTRRAGYDAARRRSAAARPPTGPASSAWGSGPAVQAVKSSAAPPPVDLAGPLARARARVETGPAAVAGRWSTTPPNGAGSARAAGDEGVGRSGIGSVRGPDDSSVLDFGRFRGWTLAQIARTDPDFLEWLERMPIGRQYQREIEACLTAVGRRGPAPTLTERPPRPFARAASHRGLARQPLRLAFLHRG